MTALEQQVLYNEIMDRLSAKIDKIWDTDLAQIAYETMYTALSIVACMPTNDAVEVVRCKDCRKWCICHHSDDYYCADGERREDVNIS